MLFFFFHFSISSCCLLYCLTRSPSTFFKPSLLVCRAGTTSATVRSIKTPLMRRKHLRSVGSGLSVSKTSLREVLVHVYGDGVRALCRYDTNICKLIDGDGRILVLLSFRLNISNLLRDLLKRGLVVAVLCLQLCGRISFTSYAHHPRRLRTRWLERPSIPCCLRAVICCAILST